MNVLITGATSMIGAALAKSLAEKNNHVVAVLRSNSSKESIFDGYENIDIVHCDMKDYYSLSTCIQGEIDAAFLAAWNGTRGSERMDAGLQIENEQNNLRLLLELKKMRCKKILTAGSQEEYGLWTSKEKLSETQIPHPNTEYGKRKLIFYQKAQIFCAENDIVLIEPRIFSLYGPRDYEKSLIMSMLRFMLSNEPCKMTACVQLWDYLYIDDAIDGLKKLLVECVPDGIYNFGFGESRSLKEFIEIMYRMTQSSSRLEYGAISYPKTGMTNVNPDVSKLRSIGWTPKVSFEEGIQKVITMLRNDGRCNHEYHFRDDSVL